MGVSFIAGGCLGFFLDRFDCDPAFGVPCKANTRLLAQDPRRYGRDGHTAARNINLFISPLLPPGPMPLKPLFVTSAVIGVLLIMALLTTTVWLYVSRKRRVPYSLVRDRLPAHGLGCPELCPYHLQSLTFQRRTCFSEAGLLAEGVPGFD